MATANRPVQTVILQNYTLDLKLLPENTRSVTAATITATSLAAEGATTISVATTAGINYTIAAGTSLSFVAPSNPTIRQQVLVLANATLSGATTVTLTVAPLLDSIAANSTARLVQDMFPLLGITSFGLQPSPTVVDTTHSQSGSGTSSAIIRSKREISVEGIEYVGDIALEQFIKRTHFDPVYMNRELYAIATYPNGAKFEGAAKSTALNLTGTPMEVMKYTFTLEFQDDWIWTPAYYATGGLTNGFPSYNL
ncbi:MAG: hypothetical protein ACO3CD_04270 [Candidatus Nanopelagicaceae bacterium]